MPNVVPISPFPIPPNNDSEHHVALRRWGRRLARLCSGLLGLGVTFTGLVLALGLAGGGAFLWLAPGAAYVGVAPTDVPGLVPFGELPAPTRWAYAATFALNAIPALIVLAQLRCLALAYAEGIAFGLNGVRRLHLVGLCLVACAFAPAVGHGLVLQAGHGVDLDWLHASSLYDLVLAVVAVTLAEVARIGHAIQTDRDGFI